MRARASVTLFLALVTAMVSALILALTESARTAGARFYVKNMADSTIDSLFSMYHRDLWEQYRLLGYPFLSEEITREELNRFMEPYAENCGLFAVASPSAELTKQTFLTQEGGRWFEQEIMDYLSFGWISLGYTPESAAALMKQIKEAGTMDQILKDYGLRSREAIAMEKSLMKIRDNLDHQTELRQKARDQVASGDDGSFYKTASELEKTKKKLPSLVSDYDKKADSFRKNLLEVEKRHEKDMEELEEANRAAIQEEIASYRSYTDQDGERRAEIDGLPSGLDSELSHIDSVKRFAAETREYIDEHEDDDDDEDGGSSIDERALWAEVAEAWDGVVIPDMTAKHGIRNEETEHLLESVLNLAQKGFLGIVLPPDRSVSDTRIDRTLFPSVTSVTPRTDGGASLLTALAVDAYAARYLNSFTDHLSRPVSLELEYAAAGKDSDLKNLSTVLTELFAIREALNFLSIMGNAERKAEASAIAESIGAVTMVPGLSLLVECLVITAWATVESFMDLRLLLEGNRAALIKGSEDWMTDLTDVLAFAVSLRLPEEKLKNCSAGQSYEDYLTLLLFPLSSESRNYRIMDMIQMNLRLTDPAFLMRNSLYGLHVSVRTESRFLFSGNGLVQAFSGAPSGLFSVSADTVRAY